MNAHRPGGSLRDLRISNAARVLDLIAQNGPLHRAEIARRANISRTTATTISRQLVEGGVLIELSGRAGSYEADGRAGDQLAFNPKAGWTAGISQILDRICVHISDLMGERVAAVEAPVTADDDWRMRAEIAARLLDEALAKAGGDRTRLLGVGVGLPGQIDPRDGVVHGALAEMPWNGVDARKEMSARLGVPVFIDNYVRLETLAESKWGAGKGLQDVLYVNMANGIAMGMILEEELYRGTAGGAGELGHVSIDVNGPACRCGNRGCLVLYAGAPAILSRLEATLGPGAGMEDVLAASAAGDRAAHNVLAEAGSLTGRLLASLCNLLNPQRIIVGGQTARAGAVVIDPLRQSIAQFALRPAAAVDVVAAELGGGAASGAAGGAALILAKMSSSPAMLDRLLDGSLDPASSQPA